MPSPESSSASAHHSFSLTTVTRALFLDNVPRNPTNEPGPFVTRGSFPVTFNSSSCLCAGPEHPNVESPDRSGKAAARPAHPWRLRGARIRTWFLKKFPTLMSDGDGCSRILHPERRAEGHLPLEGRRSLSCLLYGFPLQTGCRHGDCHLRSLSQILFNLLALAPVGSG